LAVFATNFVLQLAIVPSPRKYLFSFTGLIDLSAVLFLCAAGPQRIAAVDF
jgi:voltage-gated potassium channel